MSAVANVMTKVKEYAKREYWDERYNSEEHFEWLQSFSTLKSTYLPHLSTTLLSLNKSKSEIKILHIGCGNSTLSVSLYEEGFENITNVDYSEVVIHNMREKYEKTHPNMTWITMDCRQMQFDDNEFDVVIDKATLDAISCGGVESVQQVAAQVHRVLRPAHPFLLITYSFASFFSTIYE